MMRENGCEHDRCRDSTGHGGPYAVNSCALRRHRARVAIEKSVADLLIRADGAAALSALPDVPPDLDGFRFRQFAIDPGDQFSRKVTHCISPPVSLWRDPLCRPPWKSRCPILRRFRDTAGRSRAAAGIHARNFQASESHRRAAGTSPFQAVRAPAWPHPTVTQRPALTDLRTGDGSWPAGCVPDCGPRETANYGYFLASRPRKDGGADSRRHPARRLAPHRKRGPGTPSIEAVVFGVRQTEWLPRDCSPQSARVAGSGVP